MRVLHVGHRHRGIGHAVVHHGINGHRDRVFGEDLNATTIIIWPFYSSMLDVVMPTKSSNLKMHNFQNKIETIFNSAKKFETHIATFFSRKIAAPSKKTWNGIMHAITFKTTAHADPGGKRLPSSSSSSRSIPLGAAHLAWWFAGPPSCTSRCRAGRKRGLRR